MDHLRSLVEEADRKSVLFAQELEDEKRKVEDLTFQLEENKIFHDDLEVRSRIAFELFLLQILYDF